MLKAPFGCNGPHPRFGGRATVAYHAVHNRAADSVLQAGMTQEEYEKLRLEHLPNKPAPVKAGGSGKRAPVLKAAAPGAEESPADLTPPPPREGGYLAAVLAEYPPSGHKAEGAGAGSVPKGGGGAMDRFVKRVAPTPVSAAAAPIRSPKQPAPAPAPAAAAAAARGEPDWDAFVRSIRVRFVSLWAAVTAA